MTDKEVMSKIKELSNDKPLLVTFSGGNPAMHNLSGVIKLGHEDGYTFTMETQGTISHEWFDDLDSITISPKPPSSGMVTDWGKLSEAMNEKNDSSKVSLKVVVSDEDDYAYALEVFDRYPESTYYITPCNTSPGNPDLDAIYNKTRWVIDMVLASGRFDITILPQLHVLLWGNERGK
jgi:7-carboxy-7-deazaguanine synthase